MLAISSVHETGIGKCFQGNIHMLIPVTYIIENCKRKILINFATLKLTSIY